MTDTSKQELIEKAAKAILDAAETPDSVRDEQIWEWARRDARAALAVFEQAHTPTDALIEEALTWIGQAWDDGNASGLDGWIGPGRGAGEVDREAQHARTRMVHKAEAALRVAYETRGEGR